MPRIKKELKTKSKKVSKIKSITDTEKINETKREVQCDRCKRLFYRKMSNNKGIRQLTQVNEASY